MLTDVAFIGYKRNEYRLPEYYKPHEIHIAKWDAETLQKHSDEPLLILDDALEKGETINAVGIALKELGIRKFDFAVLRNIKRSNGIGRPFFSEMRSTSSGLSFVKNQISN